MSELLSLPRAARRVGVTARWLRDQAEAGRVPHLRAGTRYLFDLAALTEALCSRAAQPHEADHRQGVANG